MLVPFLIYLLSFGGGLALAHLVCASRPRFPHVAFVVLGSLVSLVAGLSALHEILAAHVDRSLLTALWWPLFGMGFLVVGCAMSVLWLVLVRAIPRLLGLTQASEPPEGDSGTESQNNDE